MAKLTRKSYKRKKIAFAAVILGGVALVSSGFAAFVLSQDKTVNGSGSINVGEVTDGALEMTITSKIKGDESDEEYPNGWKVGNPTPTREKPEKDTFRFDAQYGDTTGRAKWDGNNYEHLEIQYTVVVSSVTKTFDCLTIKMDQNAWVDAQVAKGNIVAPSCYKTEISSKTSKENPKPTITVEEGEQSDTNGKKYTWTAVYSVVFAWGETFKGVNPTVFYDGEGSGISYNDMKTTIGSLFTKDIPDFTITFVAHAN